MSAPLVAKKKKRAKKAKKAHAADGEATFRPFAAIDASRDANNASKKKRAGSEAKTPAPPAAAEPARPPAIKTKRAAREAAESDEMTFAAYMSGVRALDEKNVRIPATQSRVDRGPRRGAATDHDAPARDKLRALVVEGIRFETSDDGEHIEGRRLDAEPREVRRLRRGQVFVDGQLDLHGMSAAEARQALEQFIEKRRKQGDRVLKIVHGKGRHSPRGFSVLRGEIAAWLSQGPAKRHVAAFATAPDELGGGGALLVQLAR